MTLNRQFRPSIIEMLAYRPAIAKASTHALRRRSALFLLLLVASLLLACNPLSSDGEDTGTDSEGPVEVNFERPSGNDPLGARTPAGDQSINEPSGEDDAQAQATPAGPTPAPPAETSEQGSAEAKQRADDNPAVEAGSDESIDLVWAFLSQCVSLRVDDLSSKHISGQWFVRATGEDRDRYGIWKVDPASGSIEPHNIRARQWEPRINPSCTDEDFADFYQPTPSPQPAAAVTGAGQAATSLWATLVKCYPEMSPEDLQASLNPARSEWIVTGGPDVGTNIGVWVVSGSGEVTPYNRQAQGIYDQLDTGLC